MYRNILQCISPNCDNTPEYTTMPGSQPTHCERHFLPYSFKIPHECSVLGCKEFPRYGPVSIGERCAVHKHQKDTLVYNCEVGLRCTRETLDKGPICEYHALCYYIQKTPHAVREYIREIPAYIFPYLQAVSKWNQVGKDQAKTQHCGTQTDEEQGPKSVKPPVVKQRRTSVLGGRFMRPVIEDTEMENFTINKKRRASIATCTIKYKVCKT